MYRQKAQYRLRRFRKASTLAVALTATLLLFTDAPSQERSATAESTVVQQGGQRSDSSTVERVQQATRPVQDLAESVVHTLPRIAVAVLLLVIAGVLSRFTRPVLHKLLHGWQRANAVTALVIVAIWVLAAGAAVSAVAGDLRVLVGAVGLFGLALSWSLQTPIESFTGWLLNSFRGYYHVGDRIAVGDVFGDVYRIDVLTTTVWEAGGEDKSVTAAQPTGALITFPNSEVLRSNIVNYTRDFPYVWDEVTIGVANESDLAYAQRVFREAAAGVLGEAMAEPAATYQALLREKELDYDVAVDPQVYVSPRDAWTDLTVRYLVPARERRAWATELTLALARVSAQPEHRSRIISAYPRQQIELIDGEGYGKEAR